MAVENKYVGGDFGADGQLLKKTPHYSKGGETFTLLGKFEMDAADDDGSIYRIAKDLDSNLILVKAEIFCDAITGATDVDLGLYEPKNNGTTGAVVDKDVFADGMTLAVAKPLSGAPLFGLKDVDIANITKRLWEHAGATAKTRPTSYDLALTANVAATASGTVAYCLTFVQG